EERVLDGLEPEDGALEAADCLERVVRPRVRLPEADEGPRGAVCVAERRERAERLLEALERQPVVPVREVGLREGGAHEGPGPAVERMVLERQRLADAREGRGEIERAERQRAERHQRGGAARAVCRLLLE